MAHKWFPDDQNCANGRVVVVGAGAAGCAAGAALAAARPDRRVLLLEAGPGEPVPASANFLRSLAVPGRTWAGLTVQRTPGGPVVPYVQGRGLGGGSAVNAGLLQVPAQDDARRLGWPELTSAAAALVAPGAPLASVPLAAAEWGALDCAVAAAAAEVLPGASVEGARLVPDAGRRLVAGGTVEVRGDALVDRIEFEHGRAAGVVLADGSLIPAGAVVLAAGAIFTPAILLRSGIEEGVGVGLVDRAAVALNLALEPPARLASLDAAPAGVTVRTDTEAYLPFGLTGADQASLAGGAVFGIRLVSQGRGSVRLRSTNALDPPEVTFDVLGDERDRRALRAIVRRLAALARHPAVAEITDGATLGNDASPLDVADADDDTLDAWLEGHLADVFHAAGSCHAAVDRAGRVNGVENCWVVDASVLPDLPRCAPALSVMALARHLAASV